MTNAICDLLKELFENPDDPDIIDLLKANLGNDPFNEIMDHLDKCPECEKYFDSQKSSRENMERALKWFRKINTFNKNTQERDEMDSEIGTMEQELAGMSDDDLKIINYSPYRFILFIRGYAR